MCARVYVYVGICVCVCESGQALAQWQGCCLVTEVTRSNLGNGLFICTSAEISTLLDLNVCSLCMSYNIYYLVFGVLHVLLLFSVMFELHSMQGFSLP